MWMAGFVNDRSQWETEVVSDPKRVFELTDRAMAFMDSCHVFVPAVFPSNFHIMRCTPTSKQRKLHSMKCRRRNLDSDIVTKEWPA